MADIRINSLPSTATSFNTDDYIAIDGASAGTRKMLAANPPFTDVTLGASGPSVKSSLSARAPRQGLVFDGTARASYSIPAFGTGDFSVSLWINQATLSNSAAISGPTNAFQLSLNRLGNGYLSVTNSGVAHVLDVNASAYIQVGKFQLISCVRSSGTVTFYVNGIAVGSGAVATDFSAGCIYVGGAVSTAFVTGTIAPYIYNRALSASEVVALYESGAPSGADYNSASNTAVYSTDFSSSTGWTAETGWSITGGAAVLSGTNAGALYRSAVSSLKQGSRYRITFTVASYSSGGVRPWIQIGSSRVLGTARTANGTYTEEIVAPSATGASYVGIEASTSAACSLNVDDYSYVNTGLLLAPDAAQAGGGLVWYDTSGNAANITLPASGVSWNVPSSGYWGGNLTVSGTGGISIGSATFTGGRALTATTGSGNSVGLRLLQTSVADWEIKNVATTGALSFAQSATEYARLTATGNFLLKSDGVDSGNGKLQLAESTASTGGIGFGTDTSLYRAAAGSLVLDYIGGTSPQLRLAENSTQTFRIFTDSGVGYVQTMGAKSLILSTNYITALTLDSSQNATFAGSIAINNTVQTAVSVASTHKVTISIGGSTYYLLATNV